MGAIARLVRRHPALLVVTDEVYHHISEEPVHYFAALPGAEDMFERTIACCSAAKSFSVTGWKIGWTVGPKKLVECVNFAARGHSWSVNTPCQRALVDVLQQAAQPYEGCKSYYVWLGRMYAAKKKRMMAAIVGSGMRPIAPKGAYYVMVDAGEYIGRLKRRGVFRERVLTDPTSFEDWQFVKWLIEEIGVAAIPGSEFCDYGKIDGSSELKFVRFAYCTNDETIRKT